MAYHAINEKSNLTVYSRSNCPSDSKIGTLYNGEVFTLVQEHNGYFGHYEIRFLNSSGQYSMGYIDTGSGFGNLAYSGQSVSEQNLGSTSCYRFKVRKDLPVVNANNDYLFSLVKDDYIYTRGATAGSVNRANMYICGYKSRGGAIIPCDAFVTLDYTGGSMFSKNFCIYKA